MCVCGFFFVCLLVVFVLTNGTVQNDTLFFVVVVLVFVCFLFFVVVVVVCFVCFVVVFINL